MERSHAREDLGERSLRYGRRWWHSVELGYFLAQVVGDLQICYDDMSSICNDNYDGRQKEPTQAGKTATTLPGEAGGLWTVPNQAGVLSA